MEPLVPWCTHATTVLVVHMVWATRFRVPWIEQRFDAWLLAVLRNKARAIGCELLAAGCADDHVHVLVRHPPRVPVADIAHRLKGASSHAFHREHPHLRNRSWQIGYWAESISPTNLDSLIEYIANQRARHEVPDLRERWHSHSQPAWRA